MVIPPPPPPPSHNLCADHGAHLLSHRPLSHITAFQKGGGGNIVCDSVLHHSRCQTMGHTSSDHQPKRRWSSSKTIAVRAGVGWQQNKNSEPACEIVEPHITRYTSHITRHTSNMTSHTSHFTCHKKTLKQASARQRKIRSRIARDLRGLVTR
jgi:hypothetical protein